MPRIFEPMALGGLEMENRLVRSATWEGLALPDGSVTDRLVALYRDLAEGGVGLIVSSYLYVQANGRQQVTQIGAHEDRLVPGLARLAEAVHAAGGRLVGQLVHCGGQATRAAIGGEDPVAPSAIPSPGYPEVPKALTEDEVPALVESFSGAAARLKQAGFDGVQLHGAHGYLLSQFLSPLRNQRADRWGGDLQGRARFALEVYAAVRDAIGDLPVLIKLNAHDFLEGSTTEVDSTYLAAALADAGIDGIEVSGGTPGSGKLGPVRSPIDRPEDEAYFLPQARALRAAAPDVPLILVGGVRSPERIEAILAGGEVDGVALCRPLIREPALPNRWRDGDRTRAACRSCTGCFGPARKGDGIRCLRA